MQFRSQRQHFCFAGQLARMLGFKSNASQIMPNPQTHQVVACKLLASQSIPPTCGYPVKNTQGLRTPFGELMGDPDPEKSKRMTDAMLKVQKSIAADLQKAYDGHSNNFFLGCPE